MPVESGHGGIKMLTAEKKILQWAEKHMHQIAILLVCLIALYLRRGAVWWNSPDVGFYFDRHPNHTQSSFYHVLVLIVQYLPVLPLHGMKWLCILADCVVIYLCAIAMGMSWKKLSFRNSIFLIPMILSPVTYLRGAVWAQPDSIAFCLILAACLLWNRGRRNRALIPAILGAAVYPGFLLLVAGYLWLSEFRRDRKTWIYFVAFLAGFLTVQGLCAVTTGDTWQEGIRTCFRWMAYDPYEGTLYKQNGLEWVLQMINVCGYGAAMTSLLMVWKKKLSHTAALLIHIAVLLVYGSLLFPVTA